MYRTLTEIALQLNNLSDPIPVQIQCIDTEIRALGLDLGLNCGYAYALYSNKEKCWYMFPQAIGVLDLSPTRYDVGFNCFVRLQELLSTIKPRLLFYEAIRFTPSFDTDVTPNVVVRRVAAPFELLVSLQQTLLLYANDHGIPAIAIPTQVIKRVATGSGRAKKEQIVRRCNELFKTAFTEDMVGMDNAADAAFVLYAGLQQYGNVFFGKEQDHGASAHDSSERVC